MIFRSLTALGDWQFGQGIGSYAVDQAAIELNVQTRLLSWKGDCFWSLGDYVDWIGRLDVGQEANLQQELYNVILQSYGVVSVNNVSISLNAQRHCTVTYSMNTIFGTNFTNTLALQAGQPAGN